MCRRGKLEGTLKKKVVGGQEIKLQGLIKNAQPEKKSLEKGK